MPTGIDEPRATRADREARGSAAAGPGGARSGARAALALAALCAAVLLALAPWFAASAVAREIGSEWGLGAAGRAWLTASVQLGFVLGALGSALAGLADRVPAHRLLALSAALAGALTAALALPGLGPAGALALRAGTGAALAGAYPPALRIAASWSVRRRGLALGLVVGALTIGSAAPHLIGALATVGRAAPWRAVVLGAGACAGAGALLAALLVRPGPHLGRATRFDWRHAAEPLRVRPLRLANLAYLGHMWELYAMWTWVPLVLAASYEAAGASPAAGRLAAFAAIGSGALGCVAAGLLADRLGRTAVAGGSLVVSGACCLAAPLFLGRPALLTTLAVVWGVAVVADSAQFSAAVSELAAPERVGTALTVQTCLGFLLTLATLFALPLAAEALGWRAALPLLALGPAGGVASLVLLRRDPAARRLAGGRR